MGLFEIIEYLKAELQFIYYLELSTTLNSNT